MMVRNASVESAQLQELYGSLLQRYNEAKAKNLKLDMSRGKPGADQLELTMGMLDCLDSKSDLSAVDGTDGRNYGGLDGIPEAKQLMAQLLELSPEEVFVGGNSSLNLMHDCISFAFIHGFPQSRRPWHREVQPVKFLCPAPGYDRHFAVLEHFGIEMIPVPMTSQGPDMDTVESLLRKDNSIRGMWCVPKYSNPQGYTYSDETVRRLAALSPAADDFHIFWDNAYAVHHLYDTPDTLLNLMDELKKNNREDMALMFTSTSKISFPGAGIAAIGGSRGTMEWVRRHMSLQTIGYDKINQLRHARYFRDLAGVDTHMKKLAQVLRPKFQLVLDILERELGELDIAQWTNPNGGYFISLDVPFGCARRVVELCAQAGVVMTPAGATYPYGQDPGDDNIRIAPTYPSLEELEQAAELLCLCVRLAWAEQQLQG